MAVTKIHPIKSTLKKALDYITNPAKTDDKLYVSSFGCAVETADIEFEKTRLRAMNKGNNLAPHLIQAFEPGEVTPEAAHEIGRQLADSILGGKYEYVLTTHQFFHFRLHRSIPLSIFFTVSRAAVRFAASAFFSPISLRTDGLRSMSSFFAENSRNAAVSTSASLPLKNTR